MRVELTQERLKIAVSYDRSTGAFTRLVRGPGVKAGDRAEGPPHGKGGHLRVTIKGVRYYAHRLAWLYVCGVWPDGHIDHVNGDPTDNRFSNLRVVTRSENMQNQRRPHANGATGYLGVTRRGDKFVAQIEVSRKTKVLGRFDTAEEAHQCYLSAKQVAHPSAAEAVGHMRSLVMLRQKGLV